MKELITAGVDEVGRGCLAGPVVSAAVILHHGINTKILRDSRGRLMQPEGLKVKSNHSITFLDNGVLRTESSIKQVTFLEHETDLNLSLIHI